MIEKKYEWHKIAESEKEISWPENGIAVVELHGKKLCLTKWKEGWYSFAYSCPHAGGLLALLVAAPHEQLACTTETAGNLNPHAVAAGQTSIRDDAKVADTRGHR